MNAGLKIEPFLFPPHEIVGESPNGSCRQHTDSQYIQV